MKEKEYKSVAISVPISAETNRLLTESAKRARRSKKSKPFYDCLVIYDLLNILKEITKSY